MRRSLLWVQKILQKFQSIFLLHHLFEFPYQSPLNWSCPPPLFDLLDPLNPFEWPHYLLHVVCTLCDQPGVVNSGHTLVSTSLDFSQCRVSMQGTTYTIATLHGHCFVLVSTSLDLSQSLNAGYSAHTIAPHHISWTMLCIGIHYFPGPLSECLNAGYYTHHSTTVHGQCFVLVCSTQFAAIITFPTMFKHCTLMLCR